jgi:hypothetical protein
MALKSIPDGWVSEEYEMGSLPLLFRDAIVMEKVEYDKLTQAQIQEIKQSRYEAWLFILEQMKNNPNPPLPPP